MQQAFFLENMCTHDDECAIKGSTCHCETRDKCTCSQPIPKRNPPLSLAKERLVGYGALRAARQKISHDGKFGRSTLTMQKDGAFRRIIELFDDAWCAQETLVQTLKAEGTFTVKLPEWGWKHAIDVTFQVSHREGNLQMGPYHTATNEKTYIVQQETEEGPVLHYLHRRDDEASSWADTYSLRANTGSAEAWKPWVATSEDEDARNNNNLNL